MKEVASILNMQLCTTAGENPFQNGLCERAHAITDMMLLKLEADCLKINSQALLSWANIILLGTLCKCGMATEVISLFFFVKALYSEYYAGYIASI